MTEQRYTAADFANADFARHPNGGKAYRREDECWRTNRIGGSYQDVHLADSGWIPVREAKPITESEVKAAWDVYGWHSVSFLENLGIRVIPDPEPTNREKLEAVMAKFGPDWFTNITDLSKVLDEHGVVVKDDE